MAALVVIRDGALMVLFVLIGDGALVTIKREGTLGEEVAAVERGVSALAALSEAVVIVRLGTRTTDPAVVVEDGRTRAKWCPLLPRGRCYLPSCFATIRWFVSWGQCRGAIASICYASRRCFGLN